MERKEEQNKGSWGALKTHVYDVFMIFHFCRGLVLSLINRSLLDFWGYKVLVLILLSLKREQGEKEKHCPRIPGFDFLSFLHRPAQGCFTAQMGVPLSY